MAKLTILGTGSFPIEEGHSGPGYLLEIGKEKILIDCGLGVQERLVRIGVDPIKLDYIFLTHLHADHASELFPLLFRGCLGGLFYGLKPKGVEVFGPEDMKKFVFRIADLYHHSSIIKDYKKIKYHKITKKTRRKGFSVSPFKVEHLELPCFAYRFEIGGKTIVFAGDTEKCRGLEKAIKNADIFIADSSIPKGGKTLAHTSTTQIGEMAQKQGVKKVILSHVLPPGYKKDLVAEVKEKFDGEVTLGKDLMEIKI